MVTPAESLLTAAHQRVQLTIRRAALSDVLKLWPVWTLDDDIDESWDRFMTATLAVEERYHGLSAARSGAYYSTIRLLAGQPGNFQPKHATFDREKAIAALMLLGLIMTKKQLALNRPNAKDTALVRVSGAVTAAVLSGSRDTLMDATEDDPRSTGFVRIITGTCDFCRGLAADGVNVGTFQAHGNCVCVPGPAFSEGAEQFVNKDQQQAVMDSDNREEWDNLISPRLGYGNLQGGVPAMRKDAVEGWQAWLGKAELRVQVPNESVLTKIFKDGRFKSQFESKTSFGAYDHELRGRIEERLFGYKWGPGGVGAIPASSRPIYGYVAQAETYVEGVTGYGEIRVTIKQSARKKTTVTMADSLNSGANIAASGIDDLHYSSFSPAGQLSKSYMNPAVPAGDGLASTAPAGYGYVEAQFHGGLLVSDIEFVWFASEPGAVMVELLEKNGIRWAVDATAPAY